MDPNTFPTKGNLILAKNSLKLSRQGYELMDKKRNILIREMMDLIETVEETPDTIITLTTGKKIIVKESRQEVKNLVKSYRSECNSFRID